MQQSAGVFILEGSVAIVMQCLLVLLVISLAGKVTAGLMESNGIPLLGS